MQPQRSALRKGSRSHSDSSTSAACHESRMDVLQISLEKVAQCQRCRCSPSLRKNLLIAGVMNRARDGILGSRMSVISKTQERFEGVLHAIDPNAQTVTLSEGKRSTARRSSYLSTSLLFVVKFHGTEDRIVDEGHPTVLVKYAVFDKADLVVFESLRENTSKTPKIVSPRKSAPLATLTQHRSHVSRECWSRHVGSLLRCMKSW